LQVSVPDHSEALVLLNVEPMRDQQASDSSSLKPSYNRPWRQEWLIEDLAFRGVRWFLSLSWAADCATRAQRKRRR
jgi:hypothetical protein